MSEATFEIANKIARWIDEKKGKDIHILDISKLTTLSDCFILASGSSTMQVQSIADFVEEKAEEEGLELLRKEGYRNGRWILMDYNSVIVHIFHEEEREFYKLERLWQDANNIGFHQV